MSTYTKKRKTPPRYTPFRNPLSSTNQDYKIRPFEEINPAEEMQSGKPLDRPYTGDEDAAAYNKWLQEKFDPTKPLSFKDMPSLYSEDGSINERYDTNIGQDMLAGAGVAIQGATGNPFYDIGLALGGLGGGALNKNLKGKMKHRQDVKDTEEYNKQVALQTEAQARLEQQRIARLREQRMAENQQWQQGYRDQQMKNKDVESQNKLDLNILNNDPDEENRAMAARNLSQRTGRQFSPDYGRGWKQVKVGDYLTVMDKFKNIETVLDPETGNPISTLTTESYLDILKKVGDISDYDDDAMKNAIGQAKEMSKGLSAKAPTANAVLALAKSILKNQGKKTGTVTIGGETHEIEIPPVRKVDGKPTAPKTEESQFMPNDIGRTPDVVDATDTKSLADTQEKGTGYNHYTDFKYVPVNEPMGIESLPIEPAGFQKMLDEAQSKAPANATYFTFELEGGTYKYNFKTKKLIRVK